MTICKIFLLPKSSDTSINNNESYVEIDEQRIYKELPIDLPFDEYYLNLDIKHRKSKRGRDRTLVFFNHLHHYKNNNSNDSNDNDHPAALFQFADNYYTSSLFQSILQEFRQFGTSNIKFTYSSLFESSSDEEGSLKQMDLLHPRHPIHDFSNTSNDLNSMMVDPFYSLHIEDYLIPLHKDDFGSTDINFGVLREELSFDESCSSSFARKGEDLKKFERIVKGNIDALEHQFLNSNNLMMGFHYHINHDLKVCLLDSIEMLQQLYKMSPPSTILDDKTSLQREDELFIVATVETLPQVVEFANGMNFTIHDQQYKQNHLLLPKQEAFPPCPPIEDLPSAVSTDFSSIGDLEAIVHNDIIPRSDSPAPLISLCKDVDVIIASTQLSPLSDAQDDMATSGTSYGPTLPIMPVKTSANNFSSDDSLIADKPSIIVVPGPSLNSWKMNEDNKKVDAAIQTEIFEGPPDVKALIDAENEPFSPKTTEDGGVQQSNFDPSVPLYKEVMSLLCFETACFKNSSMYDVAVQQVKQETPMNEDQLANFKDTVTYTDDRGVYALQRPIAFKDGFGRYNMDKVVMEENATVYNSALESLGFYFVEGILSERTYLPHQLPKFNLLSYTDAVNTPSFEGPDYKFQNPETIVKLKPLNNLDKHKRASEILKVYENCKNGFAKRITVNSPTMGSFDFDVSTVIKSDTDLLDLICGKNSRQTGGWLEYFLAGFSLSICLLGADGSGRESIISTDKTGNSVKESVLKLIVQSLFDSLNEASKEATLNHSDGETSFAYKMYMECADILEDELFELTPDTTQISSVQDFLQVMNYVKGVRQVKAHEYERLQEDMDDESDFDRTSENFNYQFAEIFEESARMIRRMPHLIRFHLVQYDRVSSLSLIVAPSDPPYVIQQNCLLQSIMNPRKLKGCACEGGIITKLVLCSKVSSLNLAETLKHLDALTRLKESLINDTSLPGINFIRMSYLDMINSIEKTSLNDKLSILPIKVMRNLIKRSRKTEKYDLTPSISSGLSSGGGSCDDDVQERGLVRLIRNACQDKHTNDAFLRVKYELTRLQILSMKLRRQNSAHVAKNTALFHERNRLMKETQVLRDSRDLAKFREVQALTAVFFQRDLYGDLLYNLYRYGDRDVIEIKQESPTTNLNRILIDSDRLDKYLLDSGLVARHADLRKLRSVGKERNHVHNDTRTGKSSQSAKEALLREDDAGFKKEVQTIKSGRLGFRESKVDLEGNRSKSMKLLIERRGSGSDSFSQIIEDDLNLAGRPDLQVLSGTTKSSDESSISTLGSEGGVSQKYLKAEPKNDDLNYDLARKVVELKLLLKEKDEQLAILINGKAGDTPLIAAPNFNSLATRRLAKDVLDLQAQQRKTKEELHDVAWRAKEVQLINEQLHRRLRDQNCCIEDLETNYGELHHLFSKTVESYEIREKKMSAEMAEMKKLCDSLSMYL